MSATWAESARGAVARVRGPGRVRLFLAVLAVAGWFASGVAAWAQTDSSPGKTGTFDKAKLKARMLDKLRAKLEVKDDAEWTLIQARIEKVTEAQHELSSVLLAAQHRSHSSRSSSKEGSLSGLDAPRHASEGDSEAEIHALQKLVETHAPAQELKPRVARVRDLLRDKQEKLNSAREDLRAVLSSRQEAIAILSGLLR